MRAGPRRRERPGRGALTTGIDSGKVSTGTAKRVSERESLLRTGPRDMDARGSAAWCVKTIDLLKSRLETKEMTFRFFEETLAEIEQVRAWEKVPPPDGPYPDLESFLRAEFGKSFDALIREKRDRLERIEEHGSLRASALDDVGDRNAPVGSPAWAKWFVMLAKEQRTRIDEDVAEMQRLLNRLEEGEAWKALGLLSFGVLCEAEIGISEREAESIRKAKKGTTLAHVLAADPAVAPLPPQEIGKGKPGPGRGKETGDDITRLERGTSASYLVRRLKRDAPEIAAALARGEYPSARAAAIAAGIVRVPTALGTLRRAWAKASDDEREAFKAECLEEEGRG